MNRHIRAVEVIDRTLPSLAPIFDELRMIKTPEEVEALRRANRAARAAWIGACRQAKVGMTEREFARFCDRVLGDAALAKDPRFATGPARVQNRAAMHAAIEKANPNVGAYLSWNLDAAKREAEKADVSLPLGGLPIAIKDNITVTGEPCTCGSKMLANFVSPYDATSITQLRAAGAVPFGRTNMDEFAMGSSTENSALGVTRNPWDESRIPGGSSGGSAAAVGANLAIAALGSDTGGSVRQPAGYCGCVGLKPTYGRVSRFGLVAFASSLDQIGPITKTVADSALLLNHLCGRDGRDSTSLDVAVPDFTADLGKDIKGMRVGLPKEYFIDGIHPGIRAAVDKAVKQFESLGAEFGNGAYRDMADLCRRSDANRFNRRVLEALIKAGALDSMGTNRATLMHALPSVMQLADQTIKARVVGQDDMFGLLSADPVASTPVKNEPERPGFASARSRDCAGARTWIWWLGRSR